MLSALTLVLCVPALFGLGIPEAQGSQDIGLKLVGTAVGDDPSRNFAIIENQSTGNQRACREGDQIGEVVIKKILSGQVVIGTQAGDQMLSMEYAGRSERDAQSPPEMARLDRKEVDSTLPDYMQLMQEIRVRPHFEAGKPAGFLVYNIEAGSIFSRMGLENGDVIKAVNGRPVATTQEAVEFYDALKTGAAVSLDILRDERAQKLHFEIR